MSNRPDEDLGKQVIQFCKKIGKDLLLVQGAGGNISWKDHDCLWIKASGARISDAARRQIFVPLDLPSLLDAVAMGKFDETPVFKIPSALRPSIETMLHACFPHRFVVHLHSVEALAFLVREKWKDEITERLERTSLVSFVPYAKPGPSLAREVNTVVEPNKPIQLVFLQNHGLILAANSLTEISDVLARTTKELAQQRIAGLSETTPRIKLRGFNTPAESVLHSLATNSKLMALVEQKWAISPDHVVFLGRGPLVFDTLETAAEWVNTQIATPPIIFIRNRGVCLRENLGSNEIEQLHCYFEVLVRQRDARMHAIPSAEVDDLISWEAETYRRNLSGPGTSLT